MLPQERESMQQIEELHSDEFAFCEGRDRWAELGFENQRSAAVLGEVCRGHRPKKNAEGEAI
jgi:hypothetical protein